MTRHIWIVESNCGDGWQPYSFAFFDRKRDAAEFRRDAVDHWRGCGTRFRVRKYVREGTC